MPSAKRSRIHDPGALGISGRDLPQLREERFTRFARAVHATRVERRRAEGRRARGRPALSPLDGGDGRARV